MASVQMRYPSVLDRPAAQRIGLQLRVPGRRSGLTARRMMPDGTPVGNGIRALVSCKPLLGGWLPMLRNDQAIAEIDFRTMKKVAVPSVPFTGIKVTSQRRKATLDITQLGEG